MLIYRKLNLNQQSTVRTACVCVRAHLWYIIQHRNVLMISFNSVGKEVFDELLNVQINGIRTYVIVAGGLTSIEHEPIMEVWRQRLQQGPEAVESRVILSPWVPNRGKICPFSVFFKQSSQSKIGLKWEEFVNILYFFLLLLHALSICCLKLPVSLLQPNAKCTVKSWQNT